VSDMQTFRNPYLPHPNSDLDVLYMNLDLLDESYPMVKSKLPFDDLDQGGLTGYAIPVRPSYRDMLILGVNICPPLFYGKACVPENIHNDQNWLKTMIRTTSPM
jgi:hypothetical protein